eukprot:TRINITY_DN3717_c0_g1_i1.p1 TRINITY_DN3717_c0_g1~~TRINITY_DN3717_c0_g1_i1.p1  ORF type:complete len:451 (-),score=79.28 TRINITY_DN3717_c0_g1_i1:25-1377(-)
MRPSLWHSCRDPLQILGRSLQSGSLAWRSYQSNNYKGRFVDQIRVKVEAGKGGDGCMTFMRKRFHPVGRPGGGNGGDGGNVIIQAATSLQDLSHVSSFVRGQNGENGKSDERTGRCGTPGRIIVPTGTIVYSGSKVMRKQAKDDGFVYFDVASLTQEDDDDNAIVNPPKLEQDIDTSTLEKLADLDKEGDTYVCVNGGKGGRGNMNFASGANRSPQFSEPGEYGEERVLYLELRLLADVGLVGFPNAGKSSFLASVTDATPEIANYPFTTLHPNVGVAFARHQSKKGVWTSEKPLRIADIPGLIDGAHENRGLGHHFLRHVSRTLMLSYVLDMSEESEDESQCMPWQRLLTLKRELDLYEHGLHKKVKMILANKMDCPNADENLRKLRRKTRLPILPISALHKGGVEDAVFFMRSLANEELEVRRKQEERQRYLQLVADQNALSDQNNRK